MGALHQTGPFGTAGNAQQQRLVIISCSLSATILETSLAVIKLQRAVSKEGLCSVLETMTHFMQGKIKSLEQIYLFSMPVKEYQIVENFLGSALKDEVMKIMPVQKQTRAGQRTRFKAFVVVGDHAGHVGLGVKCAKEVSQSAPARQSLASVCVLGRASLCCHRLLLASQQSCYVQNLNTKLLAGLRSSHGRLAH